MDKLKRVAALAADFSGGMGTRRVNTFAAAGAYYIFVSLVPLIMLLISLLQYTPLTEEMVLAALGDYVPESMYVLVRRVISGVYSTAGTTITLSIVLTLWSASAGVKALMRGIDAVYDAERLDNYIVFRAKAIAYLLLLALVLIVSFVVVALGGKLIDLGLAQLEGLALPGALSFLLGGFRYLRFVIVMALLTVVFALLYRWMPAGHAKGRCWPGAVFTAVSWVVFSGIYSVYASVSDKYGAYGFLGSILVAMIWIYFCFMFLLVGGYINHWYDLNSRKR